MTDELLDLAMRDPGAARLRAEQILREAPSDRERAQVHRALAVILRDDGQIGGALAELRRALDIARRTGEADFLADVRATYGATLIVAGKPALGLGHLTQAIGDASGALLGTVLYRRGLCLGMLGRSAEAIDDYGRALEIFRRASDDGWLMRTLRNLAYEFAVTGEPDRAIELYAECLALVEVDDPTENAWLRISIADAQFLRGDLPSALRMQEEAGHLRPSNGRLRAALALSRADVYVACGMADEATQVLENVDRENVPPTDAAEIQGRLAAAAFAKGDWTSAALIAASASPDLNRLGWDWHALNAELVGVKAAYELEGSSTKLRRKAYRIANRMAGLGSEQVGEAWLVAGSMSRDHEATACFQSAARQTGNTNPLVSATGWLGRGRELEARNQPGVLAACSRGLRILDEYREIMGSSELRASMTHRGRDLAELALRHATHDPRTLLSWSERWRATALAQPPVTPQGDVSPALARLRDSGRRISEARAAGESTEALEKERRSLERKVRAEHHQQRAEGKTETKRFNAADLVAQVGDGAFIELVDVDGVLHVLVVSKGRVRRVIAGETRAALELAEAGRFALRRAARTGRFAPGDLGDRFQETLLGQAVRMLPDGPVTISPTAALHGAPFALMPALKARPFSIVPSAAQWLRAREVPMPRTKRRALVSGPGLLTGGAEVARLATEYPDATVLRGADATISKTMKAIDGAKLAHLATHGTFRADSPLFSALELADGQLSVYELERLKRAPYRTILSACDSGVLAPVGAQEVLGLASALFSLGSAGLVCSIAEVNDEATADLMMQVHASLDAKLTPAEALAQVRESGSPIEQATAAAFVALGV